MAKLIPQIGVKDFQQFITSEELILVGSAIILTPLLQATVDELASRIPFLAEHASIALILIAFVIFAFSSKLPKMIRLVAIGFSAGLAITAIAPFIPTGGTS